MVPLILLLLASIPTALLRMSIYRSTLLILLTSSTRTAHQPAHEAGTWFQDYFVNLVRYANPAL